MAQLTNFPRQKRAYALRLEDHRTFVEGSPENLNPNISLDQQADLLPYDTKFEVPRNSIIFGKFRFFNYYAQITVHLSRSLLILLFPSPSFLSFPYTPLFNCHTDMHFLEAQKYRSFNFLPSKPLEHTPHPPLAPALP